MTLFHKKNEKKNIKIVKIYNIIIFKKKNNSVKYVFWEISIKGTDWIGMNQCNAMCDATGMPL